MTAGVAIIRRAALERIFDRIVDGVAKADPVRGVPGGLIYMALVTAGITVPQYEWLMATLVATGRLRRSGVCYFIADGGAR
jgi:hypothetical protein